MGLKAIGRAIAAVLTLTGLVLFHDRSFGSDQTRAKHLLQQACVHVTGWKGRLILGSISWLPT